MYNRKRISGGLILFYGKSPDRITIEDSKGYIIAVTRPHIILDDSQTYLSTPKPSFGVFLKSLFNTDNKAGSSMVFLKARHQYAHVFRYSVRIGCTEFTNKQIRQIIAYAKQHS